MLYSIRGDEMKFYEKILVDPHPPTPPLAIEMPPKKGGFRGSVGGEVVEMKRNIKILNLVRNFT